MRRQRPRIQKPQRHGRRDQQRHGRERGSDTKRVLLYGLHPVEAALANPRRRIGRLLATENAAHRLGPLMAKRGVTPELVNPKELDRRLGADAVHQGVALESEPLPPMGLDKASTGGILLVLDQVTDPQ
ncbi:MAG TPA: RNA methyltransferase substrate-binding domain-containing protein, partial [Methyloceanibacter sp.]|nr:RNA methyltransferase substrate-binding domain-containing protein [Methyloceanibacter sp.]